MLQSYPTWAGEFCLEHKPFELRKERLLRARFKWDSVAKGVNYNATEVSLLHWVEVEKKLVGRTVSAYD